MKTLFSDNSKSNSEVRNKNIDFLESLGFFEAGTFSRSGELLLVEKSKKTSLQFGLRCNISGKKNGNKYFTLQKDFSNSIEANSFFESIKDKLTKA